MGDQENPANYKIRLLPDKNGDFYTKYFYHFFQEGDKTYYIKCKKSPDNMSAFCPWCAVNQILWKGNKSDKEKASRYRRNERYVSNIFIIDDPRDHSKPDEKKANGKTKLYEFPATVEAKIKKELTNDEEGFGPAIFDPETGHDLIISIKAKKPDEKGKVWPDYSLTDFSRKASSITKNKKDIAKIMENVYDLSEYLDNMDMKWEDHERLLKEELVWDEIEDDFIKYVGSLKSDGNSDENKVKEKEQSEEDNDQEQSEEDNDQEQSEEDNDQEQNNESSDDGMSDEDLMKELENL